MEPGATRGPAVPLDIQEEALVWLGHGFLRNFKTAWDYDGARFYLLKR